MPNLDQVKLLKQGAAVWNAWREKNQKKVLMLSGANLSERDLSGVNLSGANLSGADLSGADLSGSTLNDADLSGADLSFINLSSATLIRANLSKSVLGQANLSFARLSDADLSGANLKHSDLIRADLSRTNCSGTNLSDAYLISTNLSGANLTSADLTEANLSSTNLSFANLTAANLGNAVLIHTDLREACFFLTRLSYTIFGWVDLRTVGSLDTVIHDGPSGIDVKTVKLPESESCTHFLRGAGFSDAFINALPMITTAIHFTPCFISYANPDEALAKRLYNDLQNAGVRCWLIPHDFQHGTPHRRGIENAVRLREKVLFLCSRHVVQSDWAAYEVETALNHQEPGQRGLLLPLQLDETIMRATEPWAVRLREEVPMADFTGWQDAAIYQWCLTELLGRLNEKGNKRI